MVPATGLRNVAALATAASGVMSSKGPRGGDSAKQHLGVCLECAPGTATLGASALGAVHRSACHVVAPAFLRTDAAANARLDGPLPPSASSLAAVAAEKRNTGARPGQAGGLGQAGALAAPCALALVYCARYR